MIFIAIRLLGEKCFDNKKVLLTWRDQFWFWTSGSTNQQKKERKERKKERLKERKNGREKEMRTYEWTERYISTGSPFWNLIDVLSPSPIWFPNVSIKPKNTNFKLPQNQKIKRQQELFELFPKQGFISLSCLLMKMLLNLNENCN